MLYIRKFEINAEKNNCGAKNFNNMETKKLKVWSTTYINLINYYYMEGFVCLSDNNS